MNYIYRPCSLLQTILKYSFLKGRGGKTGSAFVFYVHGDGGAKVLVDILKRAKQDVPDELVTTEQTAASPAQSGSGATAVKHDVCSRPRGYGSLLTPCLSECHAVLDRASFPHFFHCVWLNTSSPDARAHPPRARVAVLARACAPAGSTVSS